MLDHISARPSGTLSSPHCLGQPGDAIATSGLPDYNWWSEASTGVDNKADATTKFPFPITTGTSRGRMAVHIGEEARGSSSHLPPPPALPFRICLAQAWDPLASLDPPPPPDRPLTPLDPAAPRWQL
jgi:hypothetical protein